MTVREFIAAFLANAPDDQPMPKTIGAFAGLPEGSTAKLEGVPSEDSADGKERICNVVVEASEDGKPAPVCLLVMVRNKTSAELLTQYFRISLDGRLEKAFNVTGKLKDGKPVRGTGAQETLDISSKEVLALMKKELEFWMKKYSKSKKQAATVGGSGSKIVAAQ